MRRILLISMLCAAFRSWAQVYYQPASLDFGQVLVDSTLERELIVQNAGPEIVHFELSTLFPEFVAVPAVFELKSGEEQVLSVQFRPRQNVSYNDELMLTSPDARQNRTIDIRGSGKLPQAYYQTTFNLYDEALKAALRTLISANYKSLGYNAARDKMYGSIDHEHGIVTCVYTGRTAAFSTRSGATAADFNCEHTWPQSLFNSSEPEKSDMHHLFPTHEYANSIRGNLPYGWVSSPEWSEGGSMKGQGVFEVRPETRGDVARALMYFSLRYGNYNNFLNAQEAVLRNWHAGDAPDSKERGRNEAIYREQNNRNPLVDFPGFLDRIQSLSGTSKLPAAALALVTPMQIESFEHELSRLDTFRVLVANRGNARLTVQGLELRRGYFRLLNGESFELEPGDARALEMVPSRLDHVVPLTIRDTLLFSTGQAPVQVPIHLEVNALGNPTPGQLGESDRIWYASGNLYLRGLQGYQLSVRDLNGQQVYFTEISGLLTEIALPDLPSGVYFAEAIKSGDLFRQRFLIAD